MCPPEFGVWDANANCPPDLQKYRSEFTKTRQFERKITIFSEKGLDGSRCHLVRRYALAQATLELHLQTLPQ